MSSPRHSTERYEPRTTPSATPYARRAEKERAGEEVTRTAKSAAHRADLLETFAPAEPRYSQGRANQSRANLDGVGVGCRAGVPAVKARNARVPAPRRPPRQSSRMPVPEGSAHSRKGGNTLVGPDDPRYPQRLAKILRRRLEIARALLGGERDNSMRSTLPPLCPRRPRAQHFPKFAIAPE